MENLIQQEIIKAVVNARNEGKNIRKIITELAREFNLTRFMVKGIIENSALYGLEQVQGPKAKGKIWKPLNHAKAIEKLGNKNCQLEAEITKINKKIECPNFAPIQHISINIPKSITFQDIDYNKVRSKTHKWFENNRDKIKTIDIIYFKTEIQGRMRKTIEIIYEELKKVNEK